MTLPITVIIVSYNSAAVLPVCIEALHEHISPAQLLVVDNVSTDTSVAVAREHGAEVIVNSVNGGFGAGCNRGARSARSDLLLFVNPDVRLTSVDGVRLREFASRKPLGLIAPRTLRAENPRDGASTLRKVTPWPCFVAREALGPVFPRETSRGLSTSLDSPGRRSWLSGALLLCARSEFLGLGGFDERLFLYYEDQELSRRYAEHGLPLSVTDAIAGRHVGGGSSGVKHNRRPIPRAASAISSIELVGIMHGPHAARRAWRLYRWLHQCAAAVTWLTARGPLSTRSAQKRDELRSTQSAIVELLTASDSCYPVVKSLARG